MKNSALIAISVATVFVLWGATTYFSLSNQEIDLRTQIEAQQKDNQNIYDKTWKIISQQANVADQYKSGFNEVYSTIMSDRYQNSGNKDGSLMKFIQEHNPDFSPSLYQKVSDSIEVQREEFANTQTKILDLNRQHDALIQKGLGPIFLANRKHINVDIVTSTRTNNAFSTHVDDDISVFPTKRN